MRLVRCKDGSKELYPKDEEEAKNMLELQGTWGLMQDMKHTQDKPGGGAYLKSQALEKVGEKPGALPPDEKELGL